MVAARRTLDDGSPVGRVMMAAVACCERWGMDKVTVDDIAAAAGISRATLYRLFPGGKDVLFEQIRVRETLYFFEFLDEQVVGASSLEELVVRVLVAATRELRADDRLQVALASRPGEVLSTLGFSDVPRIIETATEYLAPKAEQFLSRTEASRLAEWLTRVVLSYFFVPSAAVDLAEVESATRFARQFVLSAFAPHPTQSQ